MYINRKLIQDFWLDDGSVFTDRIIKSYGIDKKDDSALYDKIQKILVRSKRCFYKGESITSADIDGEITRLIEKSKH